MTTHLTRLIPRLDIKGPNLIKGIQFDGHRVLGTADEFARHYYAAGADELIFQDAVASLYRRNSLLDIVERTSKEVFIPLTVAGGLRSVDDIRAVLRAGADKVAINTAATEKPSLLTEASRIFGSQCIVSSIEAFRSRTGRYQVWVDYGREVTNLDALEWAQRVEEAGAGEILLTAIHREGMGTGYDLELIQAVQDRVSVPVIACGGAGSAEHVTQAVLEGGADAVAAASIFHYHYAQSKPGLTTMQFQEGHLRMGAHIDAGNIDFLNEGYGGQRAIMVDPTSIEEAKAHMRQSGVRVRA